MITGLIPCAGEGSRWGQFQKELLPVGENKWLIDNTIDAMNFSGAERICIVTSPNKIHTHVQHFQKPKYKDLDLFFLIQKEKKDLWGAIETFLPYATDINLFAMPDTLYNNFCFFDTISESFEDVLPYNQDLYLGLFETDKPDRFGIMMSNNKIVNKQKLPEGLYTAWGSFIFSKKIADYWLEKSFLSKYDNRCEYDYTRALNDAIEFFGCGTYQMGTYFDFASWKDYTEWMQKTHS